MPLCSILILASAGRALLLSVVEYQIRITNRRRKTSWGWAGVNQTSSRTHNPYEPTKYSNNQSPRCTTNKTETSWGWVGLKNNRSEDSNNMWNMWIIIWYDNEFKHIRSTAQQNHVESCSTFLKCKDMKKLQDCIKLNLEICIKCLEKVHKDRCRSNIHYKCNEQEYSWHYSTCGKLNNEKKYLELILENEDYLVRNELEHIWKQKK